MAPLVPVAVIVPVALPQLVFVEFAVMLTPVELLTLMLVVLIQLFASLIVTVYAPAASPLKILLAWKVVPLMEY